MKKASKYYIPAALALLFLPGCGNDGDAPEIISLDAPSFSATIDGPQSRAAETSWHAGDRIGISGSNRSNVSYLTKEGDGIFTVETTGKQIYFQDENEVVFTAYYPWNEGVPKADTKVQAEANRKSFDFLWAKASGKKDAPNVTFNFSHRMAKVSLTLKPGEGMEFGEVKAAALSLGGFRHTGSFDISTGTAKAEGDIVDKWVFSGDVAPASINEEAKTVTFSFILFPQVFSAPLNFMAELDIAGDRSYHLRANIDFTSANGEKDGGNARNEWVAGRQYNLNLTLHKTEITINKCDINPWITVKGEDIIVD